MAFTSLARWMTGTVSQKLLRMGDGAMLGRPVATFAGGVNPTTSGGAHGVVGTDDLKVTISAGLTMSVAPGQAFIAGTSSVDQGSYYVYNGAAATIALTAHAGSARKDVIYVRAQDNAEDGSGSTGVVFGKVDGTPGSGVVGTIPSGTLVLAVIDVPATSGAVTVDTSVRPYVAAIGGTIRCKSTLRPTGAALYDGMSIFETNTGLRYHWRQTGGTPTTGVWVQDTPDWIVDGVTYNGAAGTRFVKAEASQTFTTSGSGDISQAFGVTFQTPPHVDIVNGDYNVGALTFAIVSRSTTSFSFRTFWSATGLAATGQFIRYNWSASGYV